MGESAPKRPSIWELAPFSALLADPFVDGNGEIGTSTLATSCAVLELLIAESPRLERWRGTPLPAHLALCRKLASAEVDSLEKFGEYVSGFVEHLGQLPVGELMFVPGGWIGSTTTASLVYLVERTSESKFALVVCNAGMGVNYHPSRVCEEDPSKIKYQTCLRLDDIDAERFLDLTFWASLHSQWLKPSEFHRVEAIYDVLLPWVSGKPTLSAALEAAERMDPDVVEWRTAMRSGSSSGWRNLMEAVRYVLFHHMGCSRGDLKELSTLLRCEALALALNDMNDDTRAAPKPDERVIMRLGLRTAAHATLKLNSLDERRAALAKGLLDTIETKLDELDAKDADAAAHPQAEGDDGVHPVPFDATGLVQRRSAYPCIELSTESVERYAGAAEEPRTSLVSDLLQVPETAVSTVEQAVAVLVRCEVVCNELNERCKDGSSFSSRVALQLQVAELIRVVFTQVLPVPAQRGVGALWKEFPSKEMERTCLSVVYRLTLVYATAWQSFDNPSRGFDSERSVVAMCMLAVFDCVLRHDRFGLEVARVLTDDGGFCVSTSVCVANLSLYKLASTMELHEPHLARARASALEYLDRLKRRCKHPDLFTFRMPTDKIEVKKYGTTVLFLRKLMELCGYELVPRDNPEPPPEIESLMEWLSSPSSELARNQPEFGMLRDMACLFKFLATMESRESELQRQRIAPSEYVSWGLTFEDTSMMGNTFHTRRAFGASGLRWEVLNYRGLDLDTADLQVTGFGDRKIYFGEGMVVHSPADAASLLNFSGDRRPSEDDVLHAEALPTFGDTLSRQEAEMLMSYLTVPYLRIPLTLAFFATGDRVTYLFSHGLQALLRATLFDASEWVPHTTHDKIETVPVSRPGATARLGLVAGKPASQQQPVLGTPEGLLLNELRNAPESTLRPLMKMLRSINDLAEASVYSPDAALSLYLVEIALDVQSFFSEVDVSAERQAEMRDFLTRTCRDILQRWLREAISENDLETSCLLHAYLALLWSNLSADELDTENLTAMLGSMCFVRNWHGFGLSEPSAIEGYGSSSDSTAPPEDRLLRFMQAHGVDTARVSKGSLQKYVGQPRTLYLRIGAKTIRVPSLVSRSGDATEDDAEDATGASRRKAGKRLLASVPEQKLFAALQRQRFSIVSFLSGLFESSAEVASRTLTKIVRMALDTKGTTLEAGAQSLAALREDAGLWTVEARGRFLSPDKEMTLDVQGGQILWRNDELKPLPDTMVHFNDFHAIFGKQQLHCGVVALQQHRNWVHVVGTKYDLALWDEPEDKDQGVAAPKAIAAEGNGAGPGAVADEAFWQCATCTFRNQGSGQSCGMCSAPRPDPAAQARQQQQQQQQQGGEEEERDLAELSPDIIEFGGQRFDRRLDPFSKESMEAFDDDNEQWVLELLVGAIQGHYKDRVPFKLLLPHEHVRRSANKATAMAGVITEHEVEREPARRRGGLFLGMASARTEKVPKTTWKEFVMYRERKVLHVYNLQSHGRRVFKQLVYSSDSRVALHCLPASKTVFGAGGDLKAILMPEQSLTITRNSRGMVETFIPSRLLFGVVPSALLEAYRFWHGADGVLRGEPLDMESTWFGSKCIEVREDRTVVQKPFDKRRSLGVLRSVLGSSSGAQNRRLVVGSAKDAADEAQGDKLGEFHDQTKVLDLCALGFSPEAARLALTRCGGNSAFAAEWLLNPDNAVQVANADNMLAENQRYKVVSHETVRVHEAPAETDASAFLSSQLPTLGYGQVVHVVERTGDWVRLRDPKTVGAGRKVQWVLAFDPEKGQILEPASEDDAVVDAVAGAEAPSASAKAAAAKAAQKELRVLEAAREEQDVEDMEVDESSGPPAALRLVDLLEAPEKDQSLFKLLSVLVQVEDLSHILAWAEPDTGEVVLVELPRLKIRIEPRAGKLFLKDQAGWFVCWTTAQYLKLLDAHALLLSNTQRETQFLVPNHEVSRPTLKGRPFHTELLCDRGSFAWLQTMDTRYFLYRVHTSATFLISQELSASLYLVHLKLLKRRYQEAFELAPTCTVDVPFAPEEGFMWGQLQRTMDDRHPDAHAVRLRLSLAIMYAREHIHTPWEAHHELDAYLRKLPRVSASCRLSREEELRVCRLTAAGTPLIKNRLAMLTAADLQSISLKAPAPRVGGSPWHKVQSQSLEYYNNHGTTLKRLHFKPVVGEGGFDAYVADVIYSDHVLSDEESGVNRQLGFAFLYQMLTSGPVPGAKANPSTMGEIQARYLHLKLSRWGRESVAQGEVESSNSRHMAQLAAVLHAPDRAWPKLPVDNESVQLLRNGINLYTERGRNSNVMAWLNFVDSEFVQVWPAAVAANDATCRFRPAFELRDVPNFISFDIQPTRVVDTGKEQRRAPGAALRAMMVCPFEELCSTFLRTVKAAAGAAAPAEKLPFDLYDHPAAQPDVARGILTRLEEDVRGFSAAQRGKSEPELVKADAKQLGALVAELEALEREDTRFVERAIGDLEAAANKLAADPGDRLALTQHAALRDKIGFALLTQALLSRSALEDLQRANPTLSEGQVEGMLDQVVEVLVRTNRISHANRAAALARSLMGLGDAVRGKGPARVVFRAKQLAKDLANEVSTRRHYVMEADGTFDPRFLVFEYVFDILLRARQVEIVRSFAEDVREGRSHVQQMIMGAGKTTVVAPLLTLLLADGDTLVTQVMPTALLEQTRQIMRTRFAAIITKRVFTLEFDRSCEDSTDVARAVFDKLDQARRSRSVVCASPDAVKSLFLKFVEHIHSLESVDREVLFPSDSMRQNKEIVQLRDTMQRRSDMADCFVPVLDLWKDGVLIMDEVDVLLHPLRSELNFPIGLKDPIDMAGSRWDLPIHLLGAFFPETQAEEEDPARIALLAEITAVVERGYARHALQRNPHLVLLDDQFYRDELMRPAARWCAQWILQNTHELPSEALLVDYLCVADLNDEADEAAVAVARAFAGRRGANMKLANLGRDWVRVLLPHVLSKIDRVSFGILSPLDLSSIDQVRTPLSRKLMAVPFVGKDVPSRSSEFAHPDVVIGLSVLGYRYEGLRESDVRTIVSQLKADFSRQVGPRDQRPASRLFREWLERASRDQGEQLPVLPLPLFQVNDPKQLERLYQLLRKEDHVITYYLRQHVFPACMNFQSIKISACGHELGSSMLFSRRIGFSGTPSNLLPQDLGECMYEPGSDGKIIHVLSSPDVVQLERKENWTARSLLHDVATSSPPFHALIDTGALITGMDNEQVAHYLLKHLPADVFEGVVYLDRSDRKMFLQRSSGKSLLLSQSGVDPTRRFTFYDQVHTTGMDIKQAPDAAAVVTIGKDMTFRDYAQGSFRMRGIGAGQTIRLYLIPEVEQLIKNELLAAIKPSGRKAQTKRDECRALDVPAWLLINSMKMETIQYSMLSLQELFNCWRKEAISVLLEDVKAHSPHLPGAPDAKTPSERLRRFVDASSPWLAQCIALFREPVGFTVPEEIPSPQPFHDKVRQLIEANQAFCLTDSARQLVEAIAERTRFTKDLATEELEAEIVNENEQEQQQQQEEEAEEEQEKVSRYTRDDEQANPWKVAQLNAEPTCKVGEAPFYRLAEFAVRESQPRLSFPPNLLLSDNWFRPRWIGLGDRRLKNVMVVMEWVPGSLAKELGKLVPLLHQKLVREGMDPNAAALRALTVSTAPATAEDVALRQSVADQLGALAAEAEDGTYFVAVSLAEAETLRRILHTKQAFVTSAFSLVSIEDGSCIDAARPAMRRASASPAKELALSCLRFVNCDMHYSERELELLGQALAPTPIRERIHFFEDCLRLRRREKYLWGDTPLAKLFTRQEEWHLLDARAKLQQMASTLVRVLKSPKNRVDLLTLFSRADADNDGALTYSEMQRFLEDLRLGFSPADIATVVQLIDAEKARKVTWEGFTSGFMLPAELLSRPDEDEVDMDAERESARWRCSNCTYINFASDVACGVCGYGWSGTLHVPNDKWMCDPAYGGCTFFNAETNFYCDMCNKSKPSLQNVRF